jgi:hypothetical protein
MEQFEKLFALRLDVFAYAKDDVIAMHSDAEAVCRALPKKHHLPLCQSACG